MRYQECIIWPNHLNSPHISNHKLFNTKCHRDQVLKNKIQRLLVWLDSQSSTILKVFRKSNQFPQNLGHELPMGIKI